MTDTGSNERYERRALLQPGAVETWAGLDRTLNRPVTIRRAAADSETGQRLRLQAKALARVEHHGLLHILDTYDDAHHFAIVTEQLPARMLADELGAGEGSGGRLAAAEALRVVIAVTEALAVLHSAGFAHGGVDIDSIGWRAEVGWVMLNGPPTDDAVTIPATRRADLASVAMLAHRLMVGTAPQRRPDGLWELDPAVPDAVTPLLARALSATDPWPDLPSMLLALRSAADELPRPDRGFADERSVWQAERHWLAPVGILVAAAATLVGVALVIDQPIEPAAEVLPTSAAAAPQADTQLAATARPAPGAEAGATAAPQTPATALPTPTTSRIRRVPLLLESITDFDPAGDDRREHPERLIFVNDGEPTTGWSTERYSTRDFGGLKGGVGLVVVLYGDEPQAVERLVIDSPTVGWSFELYASRERSPALIDDWGAPVASAQDITGSTALDVPSVGAAALLIWITDLGDELPNGGHRVTVSRIEAANSIGAGEAPPGTDAVTP